MDRENSFYGIISGEKKRMFLSDHKSGDVLTVSSSVKKIIKPENILVICPVCNAKKKIRITSEIEDVMETQEKKLITIGLPKNIVCEHSFQIFVDQNYNVRGYQKVDIVFNDSKPRKKAYKDIKRLPLENVYETFREVIDKNNPLFKEFIEEKD